MSNFIFNSILTVLFGVFGVFGVFMYICMYVCTYVTNPSMTFIRRLVGGDGFLND